MRLPNRHSGLFQSTAYGVANVAGSVLAAISLIILSRVLGPANFGAFSVAFALTQITARVADLGLSVALQRFIAKRYHDQAAAVAAAVTWVGQIRLVAAVITVITGLIFGPMIGSRLFGLSDPKFATLGITLGSIIIVYEFLILINQSIHQFRVAAVANALQAALKLSFALIMLVTIVPAAYLTYVWYGALPLIAVIYAYTKIPARFKQPTAATPAIKQTLIKTAKFTYIAALAVTIADHLDILMVKSMLDEYQTGLYAAASRISLLFTIFAMSVGTVLNTRIARYTRRDLVSFYKKSLWVFGALLLLTPIAVAAAEMMIVITAGRAYLDAVPATQLLLISTSITMATILFISLFYALDYPRYFMYAGILQIVVLIAANYLLIPTLGIVGAAWARIIMRSLVLCYTLIASYQALKAHHDPAA